MRHVIGYLIAAAFFVGGFAISNIDWPARSGRAIPCGGAGKTVWHRTVPDQTEPTPPILLLPAAAAEHTDGSWLDPGASAGTASAEPPLPFC